MTAKTDNVPAKVRFDDEDLAAISSIDDAIALLTANGLEGVRDISDLIGDGFSLADKRTLLNVPFLIFDVKLVAEGDFGLFSVTRVVTSDGRKLVMTDGGSGVCRQVQQMLAKGITGGVMCKSGLNISEYDYTDAEGVVTPAKTFYFAL